MSDLARLGWIPFFDQQIISRDRAAVRVARVIEQQRGSYVVAGDFDGPAEVRGKLRHQAVDGADLPVVGDWVVIASGAEARGMIDSRLHRKSAVSRKAAGRATAEQVIAANVDVLFVVTAFAGDLNPRRLERYLTTAWDSGTTPVVVLNKSDLAEDAAGVAGDLRARLPFVDIVAISATSDDRLEPLRGYLTAGSTIALIGSSGVGKSTIINRLVGRDRLRIAAVSDTDGRGRHTTTARQLIELPGGALLIDTPGMRELQPWTDHTALDDAFEDIAAAAGACRFTDCSHTAEPGCGVLAGIASGVIDADRLENYRKLVRELAFEERKRDKAAAANTKRRWKQIHKAQRDLYKSRS